MYDTLYTTYGNFTKFTTSVRFGDGDEVITFWGQKVKGQGQSEAKCQFLADAYWSIFHRQRPSSLCGHLHESVICWVIDTMWHMSLHMSLAVNSAYEHMYHSNFEGLFSFFPFPCLVLVKPSVV